MKLIEILLYLTYKIFVLCIGFILLFGIAIIAALNSRDYLLFYVPLFLYYYGSGTMDYRIKKHTRLKGNNFKR